MLKMLIKHVTVTTPEPPEGMGDLMVYQLLALWERHILAFEADVKSMYPQAQMVEED